jgi:autotransporter-associated beta strand protein
VRNIDQQENRCRSDSSEHKASEKWSNEVKARILFLITAALSLFAVTAWGQLYWNTNESPAAWTAANWSTSSSGPFTTAWTDNTNAIFSAASTVTFATASIGDVTVNDGLTVTITQAGTLSTNNLVRTFNIGTGSTLTWTTQNVSSGSSSGFIKSGSGIWNIGAQGNPYTGGFTLNAGTVIVSGNNSFGTAALTINGGTIQSSGTRSFAPTSIVIGGDFTITGTGTPTFSGTVALGSAIRTITNDYNSNNNAITFSGIISNSSGGISFAATAGAVTAGSTIAITNNANSYTGITNITGGEVTFPADRCFGASPGSVTANSIVVDGGRLTLNPPASTNYTLDANRGIQVGATANTAISVKTGTSVTYNGVIADKPSTIGAWAKQGGAIFILGGVSTYSGATSINNGTAVASG